MRIGIDCRRILDVKNNESAGVGHYTYFLIKHLLKIDQKNEYFLFFYNQIDVAAEFQQSNVKIVHFLGLENFSKIPFFYRHIYIPHILKFYKLDIYHNPANIIPFFYFGKSVITLHDLAIYKNPDWFPDGQFFGKNILMPFSFFKAKKIIAVSENTKADLIKQFKVSAAKIEVIYEGVEDYNHIIVNEDKISDKFKFKNPYFLFIGTLEPRKNLVRLIEAFAEFLKCSTDKNYKLILAGKKGWKYEAIFKKIESLDLTNNVLHLGYINLEEKVYLLKNALALTYPSLYEGFGLPILEAMNLGVPIITSNIASIPELVIDNALLVDPYDINSIKMAMLKISSDSGLRAKLISKGRGIAQNFTWQSCAQRTLDLYEKLK